MKVLGLTSDSKWVVGGGGCKNTFFSVRSASPPPLRSLEDYHMQFICMMKNLCKSRFDAVSCYCYNKHVCRNEIGKVFTWILIILSTLQVIFEH